MGTYVNSTLDSWIARDFSGGSILGIGNTGNDVFLAKLNSSGTQQWIRTLGGTDANYARSVATDSSGNVYAFGTYVNTLTDNNVVKDFAGNQFLGVTSAAFSDVFLAKLNSSGTQQWIRKLGGTNGNDAARSIITDSSGNIYASGEYSNSSTDGSVAKDFAGNQLLGVTTVIGMDAFVAKLDSSGTQQWIRKMGGTGTDRAYSVAVNSSGNTYVAGHYFNSSTDGNGAKDFAGNQLLGVTTTAGNDAFLIKLDSSGTQQWVKKMGAFLGDIANAVTVHSDNVYAAGSYTCSDLCTTPDVMQDFAGNALPGVTSIFSTDAFVTLVAP